MQVIIRHAKTVDSVNVRDNYGSTPLHHVVIRGSKECCLLLLQSSAVVNAKDDQNLTPLHLACLHGREDVSSVQVFRTNCLTRIYDATGCMRASRLLVTAHL